MSTDTTKPTPTTEPTRRDEHVELAKVRAQGTR